MKMKKFALLFLILVAATSCLGAQSVTGLLSAPAKNTASTSSDTLGRGTPSGTVLGFLQAAQSGDYGAAADYLQMSATRRQSQGADVAAKLKALMDAAFVGSLRHLSTNPEGNPDAGGPDQQTIGVFSIASEGADSDIPVVLVRVADPSAGKIWLFSAGTLSKVPDLYDTVEAHRVETRLPQFPYGPIVATILAAEQGSIFEPLIASGKVNDLADAAQIAGLKASLEVPAKDYLKAMRLRRIIQEKITELFTQVDVLVAPGRPGPATKLDQPLDRGGFQPADGTPPGLQGLVQAGNLAGLPALVLPCGFADNLPVALQIVGLPFTENLLLALGREFQARTDWHKKRPPEV